MPQGVFTTDKTLSQYAAGLGQNAFIASLIAPPMVVSEQSAKITLFDATADAFRVEDMRRAPGSKAVAFDLSVTRPVTFDCEDHALDISVPDVTLADPVAAIRRESNYLSRVVHKLNTGREADFLTLVAAICTSNLTTTPSVKWNNASGKPITDLLTYISSFETRGQRTPNYVAMGAKVLRKIALNSEFVGNRSDASVKEGGLAVLADELARMIGIEKVYVAKVGKNTAGPGATPSFSDVWDEQVLIGYQEAPSELCGAGIVQPVWNAPQSAIERGTGGMVDGWTVYRYLDEAARSVHLTASLYNDFICPYTSSDASIAPLYYVTNTLE